MSKGFGIALDYTDTSSNKEVRIKSIVTQDNNAINPNINVLAPFSQTNTSVHHIRIAYSLQLGSPTLLIHLDGVLMYSGNVNLSTFLNGTSTVYAGFTSSFDSTNRQTNTLLPPTDTSIAKYTWTVQERKSDKLFTLMCPIINEIADENSFAIANREYIPPFFAYTSGPSTSAFWKYPTPTAVYSFRGDKRGSDKTYI